MRILIRALPLALAVSLLVLFALACKSGGGGDQTYRSGDKASGDLVSADPVEVLDASAERFEQKVDSLQAPDRMHATMDVTGLGTFEMLLMGKVLFMSMPGQGWIQISLDDAGLGDLGLDLSTLENIMTDHSMVDYQKLIES